MTTIRHVQTHLVRGLLIALPAIITLWLLRILFSAVSGNVTPWVVKALAAGGVPWVNDWHIRFVVPVIGLILTLLLIYLIGLIATNLLGKRILSWFERGVLKIPLVKSIYGGARQLLDAFGSAGAGTFSRVVVVEYPRAGVFTVGFVTNEVRVEMPSAGGITRSIMVFLPTTPNPTSGWLAIVPEKDVIDFDLSIEEGLKLIVSGGIVAPPGLADRIRR